MEDGDGGIILSSIIQYIHDMRSGKQEEEEKEEAWRASADR